jgi:hypothetical protein
MSWPRGRRWGGTGAHEEGRPFAFGPMGCRSSSRRRTTGRGWTHRRLRKPSRPCCGRTRRRGWRRCGWGATSATPATRGCSASPREGAGLEAAQEQGQGLWPVALVVHSSFGRQSRGRSSAATRSAFHVVSSPSRDGFSEPILIDHNGGPSESGRIQKLTDWSPLRVGKDLSLEFLALADNVRQDFLPGVVGVIAEVVRHPRIPQVGNASVELVVILLNRLARHRSENPLPFVRAAPGLAEQIPFAEEVENSAEEARRAGTHRGPRCNAFAQCSRGRSHYFSISSPKSHPEALGHTPC